jgi:two-component system, OmpR family, alkaline phosphatase synthesis response regulator PhoP
VSYQGKKVLIIEDEEEIREILSFYLQGEGLEVIEAKTGEEGIEIAKKDHLDLVITDLSMPGMKGEKVIEILKKLPGGFKIVVSTGSIKFDESIVDGALFKPFNKENIITILQKLFA